MAALPFSISRGEAGYDEARERVIWNKRLDHARAPDLIVPCNTAAEVAQAIRYAGANGLQVSPRAGGHHYEAAALRDGGLLLDLGGIASVEIDVEAGTAWVGAGIRGGALCDALAEHDLAFPVGHCIDVGLGGYLLAGGFGWNAGAWGAACTNVVAVEMVTSSGEIIVADEEHHADLLWAARGHGAGFFAAVTRFKLALHPLPPTGFSWRCAFRADSAPHLADWLNAAIAAAPREAEIGCFLLHHWGTGEPAVVLRVTACGESESAARDLVASFASPPREAVPIGQAIAEPIPFTELFRFSPMPAGKRVAADHLWSNAPLGDLLRVVHAMPSPGPDSTIDLVAFGGHSRVALPEHGALSVTGGTGVGIYGLWDRAADDAANRAWVRRIDTALAPFRTGRYVGEADLTAAPDRRAECFSPEALDRLAAVRARYHPEGRFFAYP